MPKQWRLSVNLKADEILSSPVEDCYPGCLILSWYHLLLWCHNQEVISLKSKCQAEYVKLIGLLGLQFIYCLVSLDAMPTLQLFILSFLILYIYFNPYFLLSLCFSLRIGLAAAYWSINTYLVSWKWLGHLETSLFIVGGSCISCIWHRLYLNANSRQFLSPFMVVIMVTVIVTPHASLVLL